MPRIVSPAARPRPVFWERSRNSRRLIEGMVGFPLGKEGKRVGVAQIDPPGMEPNRKRSAAPERFSQLPVPRANSATQFARVPLALPALAADIGRHGFR